MGWYTYIMNNPKTPPKPEEIQVLVPEKLRVGLYANISQVNASDNEVTVNFIFFSPGDSPQGTLVSRIVMPREHALGLAKSLNAAISTQMEVSGK